MGTSGETVGGVQAGWRARLMRGGRCGWDLISAMHWAAFGAEHVASGAIVHTTGCITGVKWDILRLQDLVHIS